MENDFLSVLVYDTVKRLLYGSFILGAFIGFLCGLRCGCLHGVFCRCCGFTGRCRLRYYQCSDRKFHFVSVNLDYAGHRIASGNSRYVFAAIVENLFYAARTGCFCLKNSIFHPDIQLRQVCRVSAVQVHIDVLLQCFCVPAAQAVDRYVRSNDIMPLTAIMVGVLPVTNITDTVRKDISSIIYHAGVHNGVADNDNLSCHILLIL